MLKKFPFFFVTLVLSFFSCGLQHESGLQAQNSTLSLGPVSNFDQETVTDWLSQIQGWKPELFSGTLCVNQGFMDRQPEQSCLLEQSLFLLKDLNVRRQTTEAGLRQILEQSEIQRLALTNEIGILELREQDTANKTAQTELALAQALRRVKQLESEQLANETELTILHRKQESATAEKQANMRAIKASLIKNAQLKIENETLRDAYQDLADRLAISVEATSK